jgi:integral membrane protein (TIGR01906 family)
MKNKEIYLPSFLVRILRFVVIILIPVIVILCSVRLLLVTAEIWIPIEYRMPGFPQDPYGFTIQDRIQWSAIDVHYLLNDSGLDYFDAYRLDNGEPLHNDRELKHMQDVKMLVQQSWLIFRIGVVLIIFFMLLIGSAQDMDLVLSTLRQGALATWIILVLFILITLFGFGFLFVEFHRVFFEGETWIFPYSDTFIRLYPERFWRDTFLYLAILTVLQSGILFWISSLILKKGRTAQPRGG